MQHKIEEHLPANFSDQSRVWIYQSNRLFGMAEAFALEEILKGFISQWKSHGTPVQGWANLFFGQFIVIIADESKVQVGGCSTDSSVHLIRDIEQKFGVNLLDSQNLAFLIKDKVQILPLNQLAYAIQNNFIDPQTLYFNNTVLTIKELVDRWIVPAGETWLANRFRSSAV